MVMQVGDAADLPRVLIVDEKLATDRTARRSFLQGAGLIDIGGSADDPRTARTVVARACFNRGQQQHGAAWTNDYEAIRGAAAAMRAEAGGCSLVLLNARLSGEGDADQGHFGEQVYDRLADDLPELPVILFTSVPQSRLGRDVGSRYLSKLRLSPRDLRECLLQHGRLTIPQTRLLLGLEPGIVADAPQTIEVFRTAFVHADDPSPVLLLGETGVGKEVAARYLHRHSPRHQQRFVAENMAAIAPDVQESELFGHEKGAFTGAVQRRAGLFELADHGTLFLDEVGDMPLGLQVKLLRALQTGEIRRVGGTETVKVDVRIIAATSRDLGTMMLDGRFRRDLYHRLQVVTIRIPPLRERAADVVAMAGAFLRKYQDEHKRVGQEWSEAALARLRTLPMPGNVRELENLVQQIVGRTGNHRLLGAADVEQAFDRTTAVAEPVAVSPTASQPPPAEGPASAPRLDRLPSGPGALKRLNDAHVAALGRLAAEALDGTRMRNGRINQTAAMCHLHGEPDMNSASCRNEWDKVCRALDLVDGDLRQRLDLIVERYGSTPTSPGQ